MQQEILDGKTISVFMDFPTPTLKGRITDELAVKMFNDWNGLMSVVDKINKSAVQYRLSFPYNVVTERKEVAEFIRWISNHKEL